MDESQDTRELSARLIFQRAPALTGALYLQLLDSAGSASAALESPGLWRQCELPKRCAEFLEAAPEPAADLQWLHTPNHALVMFGDSAYPHLLQQTPDPPIGLFIKGNTSLLHQPQLAIVGSRNPSTYGREAAGVFAKHLSASGLTITSGLAAGVDAASHRGALDASGQTIAVCGTGLDRIYPRSSEALARDIAARGALVSEFPVGTPPLKHHFPQRNRIISGLALGTLVVEAALQSGSLITARLAGDQGREVFALPGSIHNPLSKGCHQLIRQGAKLIDDIQDILIELGPLATGLLASRPPQTTNDVDLSGISGSELDKEYEILLDALGFEPASVDQLVVRTGLKAEAVASMLLILELDGRLASVPGGLYASLARS